MLEQPGVGAVVVTYHPRPAYLENLAKLRDQVDQLIVVDNGSDESELRTLRMVRQRLNFTLLENGRNFGIGAALNRGVREAQQYGCRWVALFDQDSAVTDGFMAAMIEDFRTYSRERPILQIVPRYRDPETGMERPVSRFRDGGVFLTITSGSLFSVEAFEKCGLFEEDLFIYCVDDDYSLRIRKRGYYIGVSRQAVLLHQSGEPTSRWILGKAVSTKNYRPEIRYYYARNKVWILRRHARDFPRLIVPTLREFVSIPVKIALMEEQRWKKIRFFGRGLRDGVAGRMGPLEESA